MGFIVYFLFNFLSRLLNFLFLMIVIYYNLMQNIVVFIFLYFYIYFTIKTCYLENDTFLEGNYNRMVGW